MKSYIPIISIFLLAYSNFAVSSSWYTERLQQVESKHKCPVIYGDWKNPVPFLITPNYYISWCKEPQAKLYNLIVLSANKNPDWDSCGSFINLNEKNRIDPFYIEEGATPYGKPLPMYKFWTLSSANKDFYDFLQSDELATKKTIYLGMGGLLYCYNKQWVMSGYH